MTCCFIGHTKRDISVFVNLLYTIKELIGEKGADTFYIGNNGWFDRTCFNLVRLNKRDTFPHINCNIVSDNYSDSIIGYEDNTIYPEGLELLPKIIAIKKRNEWMIDNSDYVVCHVKHTHSNAHKLREYAIKKNKIIIDV